MPRRVVAPELHALADLADSEESVLARESVKLLGERRSPFLRLGEGDRIRLLPSPQGASLGFFTHHIPKQAPR